MWRLFCGQMNGGDCLRLIASLGWHFSTYQTRTHLWRSCWLALSEICALDVVWKRRWSCERGLTSLCGRAPLQSLWLECHQGGMRTWDWMDSSCVWSKNSGKRQDRVWVSEERPFWGEPYHLVSHCHDRLEWMTQELFAVFGISQSSFCGS